MKDFWLQPSLIFIDHVSIKYLFSFLKFNVRLHQYHFALGPRGHHPAAAHSFVDASQIARRRHSRHRVFKTPRDGNVKVFCRVQTIGRCSKAGGNA